MKIFWLDTPFSLMSALTLTPLSIYKNSVNLGFISTKPEMVIQWKDYPRRFLVSFTLFLSSLNEVIKFNDDKMTVLAVDWMLLVKQKGCYS